MTGKLVLVDNYDSFTWNLVQYLEQLGFARDQRLQVIRNDELTTEQVLADDPLAILFSPGPCTPDEAGIGLALTAAGWGKVPMFGVCLGLQTIVQAMGGKIIRSQLVMHGKSSIIHHDGKGIFSGVPNTICMGRYHSLIADPDTVPDSIEISARVAAPPHEIMAIRGLVEPVVEAVQFHPESILSEQGHRILANFLEKAIPNTIIPSCEDGFSPLAETASIDLRGNF